MANVKLFIVCGYIASGKTTVADKLAEIIGADVIRTDDVRKELFPEQIDFGLINFRNPEEAAEKIEAWIGIKDSEEIDFQQAVNPLFSLNDKAYKEIVEKYVFKIKEQKERVYNEAFVRLEKVLAESKDVLLDAAFSKKEMRERVYQAAIKNNIKKVYIVQVICGENIVESRLANRRSGDQITTSNAKNLKVFRIVKKEFDESLIQSDNPKDLSIVRIVYNTGTQEVSQFGKDDDVTEEIKKDVIDVLREKYKNRGD